MSEILIDINDIDHNGSYTLPSTCPEIINGFKIIGNTSEILGEYQINYTSKKLKTLIIPDHVKKVLQICGLPDIEKIIVGRGVTDYFDVGPNFSKAKIVEFLERVDNNNPINISFRDNTNIEQIIDNNNRFTFNRRTNVTQPATSLTRCLNLKTPIYSDICETYNHFDNPLITSQQQKDNLRCVPYASYMNSGIKGLLIPSDVAYIGRRAFQCCKNLEYVIVTGNTVIGFDAFADCPNIKGVAFLDSRVFLDCEQFLSPTIELNLDPNPPKFLTVYLFNNPHDIDSHAFHDMVDDYSKPLPTYADLRNAHADIDTKIIDISPHEIETLLNDFTRWQNGENLNPFQILYDLNYNLSYFKI